MKHSTHINMKKNITICWQCLRKWSWLGSEGTLSTRILPQLPSRYMHAQVCTHIHTHTCMNTHKNRHRRTHAVHLHSHVHSLPLWTVSSSVLGSTSHCLRLSCEFPKETEGRWCHSQRQQSQHQMRLQPCYYHLGSYQVVQVTESSTTQRPSRKP